jgi:type VII secretion integral membrane protein EccD
VADQYTRTGLCRVTVVAGERRLDVGLPGDIPVAELLPALAARIGLPDRGSGGWTLRRITGPALDAGLSVDDLGIRHGEILHLRPAQDGGPVLWVDDVVDAVSAAAAELPGRWSPAAGRAIGLVVLALALSAGAAAVLAAGARPMPALVAGLGALVLVLAAAVVDRALAQPALATLLGVSAAGYASVAGLLGAGGSGVDGWAVAAAAALVGCALGAVLAPGAGPGFAAAATVSLLGAAGIGVALALRAVGADSGDPGLGASAAALTLALLAAPLFPLMAFRLSPLPMPFLPTDRGELAGGGLEVSHAQVSAGMLRADRLLTGLVAGTAALAVLGGLPLLGQPGWAAPSLLGCACLALLLRARHYRGLAQRLWLYGSGLAVLGLVVSLIIIHSGQTGRLTAAAALLVIAVIAGAVAVAEPGGRPQPRLGRLVDLVEVLAVVALVPLALQILGVYALVRTFGG